MEKTPDEIIADIQHRDSNFSWWSTALRVFTALAVVAIILFQFEILHQIREAQIQQRQLVMELKRDNADKLDTLINHIDCIVTFFQQPDRQNKTLTNPDTCNIKALSTGKTTELQAGSSNDYGAVPVQSTNPTNTSQNSTQNKDNNTNTGQGGNPDGNGKGVVCRLTLGLLGCKN